MSDNTKSQKWNTETAPGDLSNRNQNPYSEKVAEAPRGEQGDNKEPQRCKEQESECRDNVSAQKGGRSNGGGAAATTNESMTQHTARLLVCEFSNNNDPQPTDPEHNAHLELHKMETMGDGQAGHEQDGENGDEDAMEGDGDISEPSGNPPKIRH